MSRRRRRERYQDTPPRDHRVERDFRIRRQMVRDARKIIRDLEDRRRYHPLGSVRPAAALSKGAKRIIPDAQYSTISRLDNYLTHQLSFGLPDKVSICVRRKERREVLHAKRKTGKGSRSPKLRNWFSQIICR